MGSNPSKKAAKDAAKRDEAPHPQTTKFTSTKRASSPDKKNDVRDSEMVQPKLTEAGEESKKLSEAVSEETYEQILDKVMSCMDGLNKTEDFSDANALTMLTEIVKAYYILARKRIDDLKKICDAMLSKGLLDLFVKIWDNCHENTTELYGDVTGPKFNNLTRIKVVFWNFSDKCVALCKACYKDSRVIERLMRELTLPEMSVPCLHAHRIRHMLKATLGILHNLVRLHNANRQHIRKDGGIDKLLEYDKSTYLIVKAKIFIVLAYCINEDENKKIMTGHFVVKFILGLLQSAVESPNHVAKTYAFSAEETVSALNKLASNDDNKKSIVEQGILPLLSKLLDPESSSRSEQLECVNCVWSLAFHPDNREKIINEPNLLDQIKALRNKGDGDFKLNKAISSLLFVLQLEQPAVGVIEKLKSEKKHIMLSYNWEVQHVMLELRDYLIREKYTIWMDVDKMKDSILSAMADAVENAAVILVAMTESYKNSNPCRTEAEYAYKRKVPILPLLLQPLYVPDGWLGAMVGTKLYVDLASDNFIGKFTEVRNQVDGLIDPNEQKSLVPVSAPGTHTHGAMIPAMSRMTSVDGGASNFALVKANWTFKKWTKQEVQRWFKDIGIKENGVFADFDGIVLSQIVKLLLRSPETYYAVLRNDLHFTFKEMLVFTDAVETLLP